MDDDKLPRLEVDPDIAGVMYLRVRNGEVERTMSLSGTEHFYETPTRIKGDLLNVDLDKNGRILGVEVIL